MNETLVVDLPDLARQPTRASRARRLVAFLLSIAAPGGGHILLGRWRRGGVLFACLLFSYLSVPMTRSAGFVGVMLFWAAISCDVFFTHPGPAPTGTRLAAALVLWLLLLVGLRALIREQYVELLVIRTQVMEPTLYAGDHIVVEKFWRRPQRGDLIQFTLPDRPGSPYVERVVGLAGDQIELRGGALFVNGVEAKRTPAQSCAYSAFDERGRKRTAQCAEETLGAARYRVIASPAPPDYPADGDRPYIVPPNALFVLADNRADTRDSRTVGPIPADHVRGKAVFIWWSLVPDQGRWGRVGDLLH